jgi:heptosyltransferase-2
MKILLVQLSWLGDCVLTTPMIRAIKAKHPQCTLSILTTPIAREIFGGHPEVNEVLCFDKRGKDRGIQGFFRMVRVLAGHQFDLVYSIHRSARTALLLWWAGIPIRIGFDSGSLIWCFTHKVYRPADQHEVLRNLALVGDAVIPGGSQGVVPPLELGLLASPEGHQGNVTGPYVVLFPSSAWFTKQWYGEGFGGVARHFVGRGFQVIVLGSKKEQGYNRTVMDGIDVDDRTGLTSLKETMELVRGASLVVCNDSFALHLASAFKRPTVVVFCATSPSFGFGPWENPHAKVVEVEDLPCKPCRRHGGTTCPTGTNLCMTGVSAQGVVEVAEAVMRGAGVVFGCNYSGIFPISSSSD